MVQRSIATIKFLQTASELLHTDYTSTLSSKDNTDTQNTGSDQVNTLFSYKKGSNKRSFEPLGEFIFKVKKVHL